MYTRVNVASGHIDDMDTAKSLRTPTPARRKIATPDRRAREIDGLYSELHRLLAESPDSSALIERKRERLRELQGEEAAEMRRRFEASLNLSPGSGFAALREARRLLGRDEDPSSSNPPSRKPG